MLSDGFKVWAQWGAVFAVGFFALAAQALLLRTFLTTFEGHEFALGLFFASWLIWITLGALWARGRAGWLDRLAAHWEILLLLYLPAFFAPTLSAAACTRFARRRRL